MKKTTKQRIVIFILLAGVATTGVAAINGWRSSRSHKAELQALNQLQTEALQEIGAIKQEKVTLSEALKLLEDEKTGILDSLGESEAAGLNLRATIKRLEADLKVKPKEVIKTVASTEGTLNCTNTETGETEQHPVDVDITTTIAKVETTLGEAHIVGKSRAVVTSQTDPPEILLDETAAFDERTQFVSVQENEKEDKAHWWMGGGLRVGTKSSSEAGYFDEQIDQFVGASLSESTALGLELQVFREMKTRKLFWFFGPNVKAGWYVSPGFAGGNVGVNTGVLIRM